ncbi:LCP family protein [Micrococcoides hystricis]|uniref:LCP family protein n=1 Tax=Micrococcoides hystricis TaxID=1572761 RepID=A0ABV6PDG3_9MICC
MPPADKHDHRPRRTRSVYTPKRHTLRNALIAVGVLVLVVVGLSAAYLSALSNNFNEKRSTIASAIPTDPEEEGQRPVKDPGDNSLNFLILGSDTRGEGMDQANIKGEDGQRSDTMMVMHVPESRDSLYVMSVMRDLWVEIPDHGTQKINGALNAGGIPLVVRTVENTLGSRIDHVVVIDFEGFKSLTEALGGVDVKNEHSFSAGQRNPSYFPKGEIRLEGTDALRFVRERKAFVDGDYQRVKNQQAFLIGTMSQFLNRETLTNPNRIYKVVNEFSPYLSVDEGLDAAAVAGLGMQMSGLRTNNIEMFTVPNLGPSTGPGGASIVLPDYDRLESMSKAFSEDTLKEWLEDYRADESAFGHEPGEEPTESPAQPAPTGGGEQN